MRWQVTGRGGITAAHGRRCRRRGHCRTAHRSFKPPWFHRHHTGIDGPVKIPDLSWRALQKRETAASSGCTAEGYAPRNRQSRHFYNASPIRRRCFCQVHLARVTGKIGGEGGKKTAGVRRRCLSPSGKPLQNMCAVFPQKSGKTAHLFCNTHFQPAARVPPAYPAPGRTGRRGVRGAAIAPPHNSRGHLMPSIRKWAPGRTVSASSAGERSFSFQRSRKVEAGSTPSFFQSISSFGLTGSRLKFETMRTLL